MILVLLIASAIASPSLQADLEARKKASAEKVPSAAKQIMMKATKKLQASKQAEKAMQVNAKLPNFAFFNKGQQQTISEYYSKQAVVIHFYRGGWCPYCMLEMRAYQALSSEFSKAGIKVIHFTPDRESEITKTRKKHKLDGMIISDKDNKIANQLGIAFKLDKDVQAIYKQFKIDLEKSQGSKKQELPMPAVYVVDKSGTIRHAFIDADYTKRAEPKEVLAEAKKWL